MPTTSANFAARRRRRGFTLAEMLVVIGIILLVLAIALPAFTAIIGSRSKEAAQNIIAASLVRARTEAIRRGTPCGVFFYVDPDTNQSALAVCTVDPLGDPDTYDEYKSFSRGGGTGFSGYQGGTLDPLDGNNGTDNVEDEPAMTGDRVAVLTADQNAIRYGGNYAAFFGRPLVAVLQHTSGDTDGNPDNGNQNPGISTRGDTTVPGPNGGPTLPGYTSGVVNSSDPASGNSLFWGVTDTGSVEVVEGFKPLLLPAGVGVQVIRKEILDTDSGIAGALATNGNAATFRERFVRAGLIAFSPDGQLLQTTWRIDAGSRLGRLVALNSGSYTASGIAAPFQPLESQIGVVIYDQDKFKNAAADGTATQWLGNAVATLATPTPIDNFNATEGDFLFAYPPDDRPSGANALADEYAEERWLDANTIPLMVNRYSGVLVEAQ